MNEITEAIKEVLDTLPHLKLSSVEIDKYGKGMTVNMITYNPFPKLTKIMIENPLINSAGRCANFPYEVNLSFNVPNHIFKEFDFASLDGYSGQSK